MARRSRRQDEPKQQAEWLLTYSDLVTLLLTFFVALFSMSVVEEHKFMELAKSIRSAFGSTESVVVGEGSGEKIVNLESDTASIIGNERGNEGSSTEELEEKAQETVKNLNLNENVTVVNDGTSVIIRMNSLILFDSGDAEIKENGKKILKDLSKFLIETGKQIEIQGHTDNVPINSYLFPSNWELSTKRATNVVLYLTKNCGMDPTKLKPSGRGEYYPIVPNDTEENRQKNRRIDIIIEQ